MKVLLESLLLAAAFLTAPVFAASSAPAEPAKTGAAKAGRKAEAGPKAIAQPDARPKAPTKAKATAKAAKAGPGTGAGTATQSGGKSLAGPKQNRKAAATKEAEDKSAGPLADFGNHAAPAEVAHVAHWASYTRNARNKAFVVIDKKNAQLYVFDPKGKLRSATPVLLGKAIGDYTVPGVGNKPLSQLKEEEKTTPSGRFLARPGKNNHGEDIIWIDYDSALSMHRLRNVKDERRPERMATPDIGDNRISNGCVNVPHKFYNTVLKPTVMRHGAIVYVLPETRTPQQQFGSFDVTKEREKRG